MESTEFEARFQQALRGLKAPKPEDLDILELLETTESDDGEGEKVSQSKLTAINLFQHPSTHPVVLDLLMLRKYNVEWMTWEPETILARVPQDFRTSDVSDLNLHKIQAMKTLHFIDTFWQRWEVFNWCSSAFNNIVPDFEVLQVPSTAQLLVTVDTARRVREDVEYTDEVKYFMRSSCKHDGVFCPPEPLEFLEVMPDHDLIDCKDISEKWPQVRRTGRAPTADTITAEQLRRMLDVYGFLKDSRTKLQEQLALVPHV